MNRDSGIELKNLFKCYGHGKAAVQALEDISLDIRSGESVVLCGPSGSGKTTLLNMIGGLDRPDQGSLILFGRNMTALSERELILFRRESMGFIFQDDALILDMTARENVELPLVLQGCPRKLRRDRAFEMLDKMGLGGRESHFPDALSGGERQRVAAARALIHSPSIVLADEPTSNLDHQAADRMMALIDHMRKDSSITLILSSHDPSLISRFERKVELSYGRIISDSC